MAYNADTTDPVYDVVIVGAGPAGLTLALALGLGGQKSGNGHGSAKGLGLDVALIADRAPQAPPPDAPGRAYALGAGSRRMLDTLGVWPRMAHRAQAMERIVVTDGRAGGSELSLLEFGARDSRGGPALLVEEPALLAALISEFDMRSAGALITGTVTGLEGGGPAAALKLADGRKVSARLVVAADGAGSPLRGFAGIRSVAWDYGQAGLVATVDHAGDHGGVAIERFHPAGPFAMLPLTGARTSLVWTEDEAEATRLAGASEAEFLACLAPRFGTDRGDILGVGPRHAWPLKFQIARRFVADTARLALIGDAAHVVHPLAGQGLNLGFRDIAALAECVADTARLGLDFGGPDTLARYERWRRFDTVQMALGFDGLNQLFSNDHDALRLARDLGLGVVDRLPPLKRFFMREAEGLSGETPRLLAGETL